MTKPSTIDVLNGHVPAPVTKLGAPDAPYRLADASSKKKELQEKLRHGVWTVEFTKIDGTQAVMECTLDGRYLPPSEGNSPNGALADNPTTLRVYALDREGWRSFKVLNVTKMYRKPDEL